MAEEFEIGTSLAGMETLNELFENDSEVFNPDWSFQPFAGSVRLADGTIKGQGFPVAVWRWNRLSNIYREAIKALIPGLSATLYIHTPTNESASGVITWGDFQAVAQWTDTDEDKAANQTLGLVLTFTHLIEEEA